MAGCTVFESVMKHLNDMVDGENPVECRACHELRNIRATLIVNFGEVGRNTFGIGLKDEGTTERLVVLLLEKLHALASKPDRPDVFNFVCEHLPEDWSIEINLERNAGSVELTNPETGDAVDEFPDDDGTFFDHIRERVNHAREADGLSRLNWDGSTEDDL